MRRLLTATCLTPFGLLLAAPAAADTTIGASTSANLNTSTANNGAPDNIVVSSGVTVSPPSGTAITMDSSNSISNAGTIAISGIDNAVGIGGATGLAGSIANTGTITIDETYAATDTNADGVIDPPFAQGTGRYGIHVTGGGTLTGNVTNGGTITVKGNSSAGIAIDGAIAGNFASTGTVTLTGDNGYGVRLGAVSGAVALAGGVSATGQNSIAVALTGNVGGAVVFHGAITSNGYTVTTVPATTTSITAVDLLQGGAAATIGGNVGGGVLVAIAPSDTTNTTADVDLDGVADATEGSAALTSYGSAPALLIGSASQPVTLGLVAGATSGLVINGVVTGSGVYAGFDANAVQIGGLGQPVVLTGGATVTGTVFASSNGANATAIHLYGGASVPSLTNSGSISAITTTTAGGSARAIVIEAGATLPSIVNSGTIAATPSSSTGTAAAILDLSGSLTQVSNTGTIKLVGAAAATPAIDVSANTSGFSYTQALASSTAAAPSLVGAILTGSGDDSIAISAGTAAATLSLGAGNNSIALSGAAALTGNVSLGAGNDTMTLADTSSYAGNVAFGGGADRLVIGGTASFTGQILNSGSGVAVVLQGGTLVLTNTSPVALGSLALAGGTIGVSIDPASGTHTELDVAGATTVTAATNVKVSLSSLVQGSVSYAVIRSGTLSGSANLGLSITGLPYLLGGTLAASDAGGTVAVTIARKSAAALGFTRSEAAAYDPVYSVITGNAALTGLFLGLTDRASLLQRYRQMLPDHAGGVFDLLYTGTRTLAPSESATPLGQLGGLSLWAQQGYWNAHQDAVETPGYQGSGYGISGGGDVPLGPLGRVGLSVGYIFGDVNDGEHNSVTANEFEGGAYWRGDWGGFHLAVSGSGGYVTLASKRFLDTNSTSAPTLFSNSGHWHGLMIAGSARASYEQKLGAFYLRPAGTVSYYRLHEGAHAETGGGSAFDLNVAARTSDELAATGTLALGVQFGGRSDPDATNLRVEVEGGRRQVIANALGATTASFSGGTSFTLLPEDRDSGYIGTFSVSVGAAGLRVVGSATAETRDGYHTIVGRVGLRGSF